MERQINTDDAMMQPQKIVATQPYEHLSKELYEVLNENCNSYYSQRDLSKCLVKLEKTGTPLPLEKMLMVIEKHRKSALERDVDLNNLCSFGRDNDRYAVPGASTPEYQTFTQEILNIPDFPYESAEASLIGNFLLNLCGQKKAELVMDRIILRKCLDDVKNHKMREKIWYALTLNGTDYDSLKYLKKEHTGEEQQIITEMKKSALPTYKKFLEKLIKSPEAKSSFVLGVERRNQGIDSHGNIAYVRRNHIWHIIDCFEHRLQEDQQRKEDKR